MKTADMKKSKKHTVFDTNLYSLLIKVNIH